MNHYSKKLCSTTVIYLIIVLFILASNFTNAQDKGRGGSGRPSVPSTETREVNKAPQAAPAPLLAKVFLTTAKKKGRTKTADSNEIIKVNVVKRGTATHYKMAECNRFNRARFKPYNGGSIIPEDIAFSSVGSKRICVSLANKPRGSIGGLSKQKGADITIIKLVEHIIINQPILEFSQQNGFEHKSYLRRGEKFSECILHLNQGVADVIGLGECSVRLFDRRTLNQNWEFVSIRILRDSLLRVADLRSGSRNRPKTTFILMRTQKPKGPAITGLPIGSPSLASRGGQIELKLRGPEGADWRDAFRR